MANDGLSTVLMVEDDPADGYLIRKCLADYRATLDVHQVPTLAEARTFLMREGKYADGDLPACVLVDLKLPDGGGVDLIAWMAQTADVSEVPVVVLTGDVENRDRIDAYQNVACWIGKPKSMDGYAALADALGQIVASAAAGQTASNDNGGLDGQLPDSVDHS